MNRRVCLEPSTAFAASLALIVCVASAACQSVTPQRPPVPKVTSTAQAFAALDGPAGVGGAVVIDNNTRAWAARWELVTDARRQIDLATFIYEDDIFGLALLGALTERASAGVQVRLLLDGRGSLAMTSPLLGRDLLQELAATGHADIHVYNPPFNELVGALIRMDAVQLSAGNHNKLLIVDGALAITGGRNVNSHYFGTLREDPGSVDDVDVLIDGAPLVAALSDVMDREFYSWRHEDVGPDPVNLTSQRDLLLMVAGAMDAWVRGRVDDDHISTSLEAAALARLDHAPSPRSLELLHERIAELQRYPSIRGSVPMEARTRFDGLSARVVTVRSRVRGDDNPAVEAVLGATAGARREIVIQSPSFILTPQLLNAFRRASDRGVAITLLTNSPLSSDSRIAQALFIDSWPELVARIPTLRVFVSKRRQMQHAKRILFDDDLTFIGSYNFDPFSHQMNSETIVATLSPDLAAATRADLFDVQRSMDEYRVARDARGRVRRHPRGHAAAGQVVVEHGPRDITPLPEIEAIERTKAMLLSLQRLWDFDVVVW